MVGAALVAAVAVSVLLWLTGTDGWPLFVSLTAMSMLALAVLGAVLTWLVEAMSPPYLTPGGSTCPHPAADR